MQGGTQPIRPSLGVGGQPATASPLVARPQVQVRPPAPPMPLQAGTGPGTATPPVAPVLAGTPGSPATAPQAQVPQAMPGPVMRR